MERLGKPQDQHDGEARQRAKGLHVELVQTYSQEENDVQCGLISRHSSRAWLIDSGSEYGLLGENT